MGDEQRLGYAELLDAAREGFESGTDFTIAVEEEFALLDPGHARPRQPLRGGPGGSAGDAARAEPRRRADRLRGRDQDGPLRVVRRDPGRDDGAPRPARRARRHARDRARRDRDAPLGRLEGPADHRHAALPPQRRAAPLRRLAQQHLRPPRPHRHPRRRPRDRGHERPPQLPARDPRALGQLAVRRERQHRAALGADADLHALLPALRRAGRVRLLAAVRGLRPLPLRDRLGHRAHAALVERAPAPRLPDGGDPDRGRPARPRRGAVARGLRRLARRPDRARARRGRAARRTSRTG